MRFLYLIMILCAAHIAIAANKDNTNRLVDAMVSSFYTGCMGGIIAVIEEGHFNGGKNSIESNKNFYKLKQNCIKQQESYKKFLETK